MKKRVVLMELIDRKPYISIPYAASICCLDYNILKEWFFDTRLYSCKFVKLRNRKDLYVDTESLLLIVKCKEHRIYERLRCTVTREEGGENPNCGPEAGGGIEEQGYKCARCSKVLRKYDVDHVEEWSIRPMIACAILRRSASCAIGKRRTRRVPRRRALRGEDRQQYDEKGRLTFSQYFYTPEEESHESH